MVNIRKPFEIVSLSDLKRGDLISGIVNTAPTYGIVTSPIGQGFDVIMIDNHDGKKSVYLGFHSMFGSDAVVRYAVPWSIVPADDVYTVDKGRDNSAFNVGAIEVSGNRSTIYVGRGHGMHESIRIDLGTLQAATANPEYGKHVTITTWELWLDADIEKEAGKALFSFEAVPPTRW